MAESGRLLVGCVALARQKLSVSGTSPGEWYLTRFQTVCAGSRENAEPSGVFLYEGYLGHGFELDYDLVCLGTWELDQ